MAGFFDACMKGIPEVIVSKAVLNRWIVNQPLNGTTGLIEMCRRHANKSWFHEVAKLLVTYSDADVDMTDASNCNAMEVLLSNSDNNSYIFYPLRHMLRVSKDKMEHRGFYGQTYLFHANTKEKIDFLARYGVEINATTLEGHTALDHMEYQCLSGKFRTIETIDKADTCKDCLEALKDLGAKHATGGTGAINHQRTFF